MWLAYAKTINVQTLQKKADFHIYSYGSNYAIEPTQIVELIAK